MLIETNLSQINRQYWAEAQADDRPYKKLDKHLYRYIAGYSKYQSGTIFVTVCYRILQVAKSIFGCSDRQCAVRQIRRLIKNKDKDTSSILRIRLLQVQTLFLPSALG